MARAVSDELVASLEGLSGALVRPADLEYDEARQLYNGMIDKRPGLIVRCQGVGDVVDSVNFARENGFEVAVRGGGHNIAGKATTDGGVMIDLSRMKGIHVDPVGRTVRAQGGVTWGELYRETQLHGLGLTGGIVSTTGIAGLTLGGGIGYALGKHGLVVDHLLSAEIVTADGRILTASEDENDDLFWALRGGGGNFGVVASFEYRIHPLGPIVTAGLVAHPYDAARDVLRFYRDFTAKAPDDLTVFGGVFHTPDGSGHKIAGTIVCHIGTLEQAQKDLEPLLSFGQPVVTHVGPLPYTTVNTLLDEGNQAGSLNYWKSSFLDDPSDEAIDTMVDQFADCPSSLSALILEHIHGEATRVPETATAFAHRSPGYNLLVLSVWRDPAATEENVAWTRDTYTATQRFLSKGRYVNYLADDDTGDDPVRSAYGPNYDRLVQVKTKYDPDNLFHLNPNPPTDRDGRREGSGRG